MYRITCSKCGKFLGAVIKKPPVKMTLACPCGNKGSIQNTQSTARFTLSKSSSQKGSSNKSKQKNAGR